MLPFSVLRLTLPSIFETVWYNVIPAVFTYTRKPAATFFENKFCPTSDHVRWGGGDSGVEGGQVIPTSEHQTSCAQRDPPLVDCPTGKALTKAQSPVTSASSVAWAVDRGCFFTNFLSPSLQVFLLDFYFLLKLSTSENSPTTAWRSSIKQEGRKPRTQWLGKSKTRHWCLSSQLMIQKRKSGKLLGSWGCALRLNSRSSVGKIMLNTERGMLMVKLNGDVDQYYILLWYLISPKCRWQNPSLDLAKLCRSTGEEAPWLASSQVSTLEV